ncbi:MAG TPA: hypothetical protein VGB64_09675 [Actinomycetota bacterium]
MKRFAVVIAVALATGGSPVALMQPCAAAQAAQRHAGLIVETPGGTRQFCIAFTAEEEATGFDGIDLLQRAGLPVVLGGTRDLASVCRIGDDGCDDPGDCFCQCRDAGAEACRFWGYYTLSADGAWTFAQESASLRRIRDGDVDGWRFGAHAGGEGVPPRVPDERCANLTAMAKTNSSTAATRDDGLPIGMLAAVIVALAFAGGIGYGLRRRPEGRE